MIIMNTTEALLPVFNSLDLQKQLHNTTNRQTCSELFALAPCLSVESS